MNRRVLNKMFLSGEEKRRRLLITLFIGGFIILVLLGLWLNLRKGIYVGDKFLHRKNAETYVSGMEEIKVQQEGNTASFEAAFGGEKTKATLVWEDVGSPYGRKVSITFEDGEVIEGFWEENWGGLRGELVDEEGNLFGIGGNIYIVATGIPTVPGKQQWSNVFCQIVFEEFEKSGDIVFVLVGSFCYIVGAVSYLYPEETHALFSRWRYRQLELSDTGIFLEKVGAVLSMILGACFMLRLLPV